ncbi:MAG: TPMT family class I SAM-dependent methyltransferase [Lentisphaeraceae bacterium]|nr:TPMT family class I SAM-dependent methyltransferase [Lentisphaeraceae bacterium]
MSIKGTENPDSWEAIYQTKDAGWDIKKPAPPFVKLMDDKPEWLSPGNLINLGCGRGHDAAFFAKNQFKVSAVDFAPSAIAGVKEYSQELENLTPILGDILELPSELNNSFDYVLEHTCFCAIPTTKRQEYVNAAFDLLKPKGILFGLFYRFDPADDKGPPFAISEEELRKLFEPKFKIFLWETPNNSHGRRKNRERLIAMRAKK